jgi:hypothetical protein
MTAARIPLYQGRTGVIDYKRVQFSIYLHEVYAAFIPLLVVKSVKKILLPISVKDRALEWSRVVIVIRINIPSS